VDGWERRAEAGVSYQTKGGLNERWEKADKMQKTERKPKRRRGMIGSGRAAGVWARGLKERLEDGRTGTVDL